MVSKIHPAPQTTELDVKDGDTATETLVEIIHQEENPIPQGEESGGKPSQSGIGLENLRGLDFLQIRQTNRHMEDFANVQNNYDVEKREGAKIFYGIESTDPDVRAKVQSSTSASQPFAIRLIDRDDGNEIVEVERQGLNEAPTFVYTLKGRQKSLMGGIQLRFSWKRLSPTFTVYDKDGVAIMKLVGPTAPGLGKGTNVKSTTFTIFKAEGATKIGTIVKDGDIFGDNKEPSTAEEIIRIIFDDKHMNIVDKALIVATAFTLDYTQFKQPSASKKLLSLLCLQCC